MEIKITASMLKQWIKPFFFLSLATFTCNAFAEYYYVYPAPTIYVYAAPAIDCMGGCDVYHYHYKYHRYHYHKHYRPIKHYKRILVPVAPCSCCGYGCAQESISCGYYYYNNDCPYDPDMATGDDNQSIHPDMDIDY